MSDTPQPPTPDGVRSAPDADEAAARPRRHGLRVLLTAGRPRASRAQVVVALLCGLLGFALVTQVHSQQTSGLTSARQGDLVDVLDNLSARSERLRTEIGQQQDELDKLTTGTNTTQEALQDAEQRASTLEILAGTQGASGPGISLTISDPTRSVTADVLLETLEELRDAGAEAIEIQGAPAGSGPTVRLVASSYLVDATNGSGVVVDGTTLTPPYLMSAIGDAHTMAAALAIPGGVLDTLKGKNASGVVDQLDQLRISALHVVTPPRYAHPAPSASSSAGG